MTDGLGASLDPSSETAGADGAGEADAGEADAAPRPQALRTLFEWLLVAVCALVLALLLQVFLVQAFSIPSKSMEPTLSVGDRLVVYKLGYRLHDIGRGDVVVFHNPQESQEAGELIKRVVAVGGETFELRGGQVHIDGRPLEEPYLKAEGSSFPKQPIPGCLNAPSPELCEVPEGKILVLGDHRQSSRDGRYFGPIDVDTVVGRAFMKYWPPNDLGGL